MVHGAGAWRPPGEPGAQWPQVPHVSRVPNAPSAPCSMTLKLHSWRVWYLVPALCVQCPRRPRCPVSPVLSASPVSLVSRHCVPSATGRVLQVLLFLRCHKTVASWRMRGRLKRRPPPPLKNSLSQDSINGLRFLNFFFFLEKKDTVVQGQ